MTHPLDGCFAKIRRAHEHIRNLKPQIRRFEQSHPYTVIRKRDPKTRQKTRTIHFTRQPPIRLALLIGDAVHNLRSALDHLVCQLVIHGGGKVIKSTEFPIKASRSEFENKVAIHLAGASPYAIRLVAAHKPYKGGNESFWALQCLDIADKHKMLIPTWVAIWKVTDSGPLHTGAWIDLSLVLSEGIPLEEGADIDSLLPFDDTVKMKMKRQFSACITLGDVEGVKGKPVISALDQLVSTVTQIVNDSSMAFFPLPPRRRCGRHRRLP